jgi:hypothetical protein
MAAWHELRQLIFQRSPQQIARMEERFMPARQNAGACSE